MPGPKAYRSAPSEVEGLERSLHGEAIDLIGFAVACFFLLAVSAQKLHVKPQKHSTRSIKKRSTWRISSTPTAILDV
jgi:hypothetical protein